MAATFHEGELALQRQAGSLAKLAEAGPRVIRDHMPEQHRDFFAQLPWLIAGSVDSQGQPWASVLAGAPGFAYSPHPRQLVVEGRPSPHDPLGETLAVGAPIGLLGIEPHTRRRNRLNGHITQRNDQGFAVRVDQSFGNCPKYIQARKPEFVGAVPGTAAATRLNALDDAAVQIIGRADTFFIATAHPLAGQAGSPAAFGVDVSHRGGKPGFVRTDPGSVLTVPDFTGNSYFNTLGNLVLNARCGLLFIDFEHGDLLYLAASAEILTAGTQLATFVGAQRLLRLHVRSVLHVRAVLPLRWGAAQLSPALEGTGSWG